MKIKFKRGQEEMVGFALIIILVAVIILVFLGFSLKNNQKGTVESYEVDSFIQSFLQYTTECENNFEYLSIQKLIFDCSNKEVCSDGKDACEVLNTELTGLTKESWKVEEGSQAKGYELKILSNEEEILPIKEGNETKNSKGSSQEFFKTGNSVKIFFTVYS